MNNNGHSETTLVLGGTGKTGRRVAERLAARGRPVRIGSRSGQPRFDWHDRDTWAPALNGVTAAYIAFYPDIAVPGASDTVGAFAEQAAAAGVRRLVLLSGRGEPEAGQAERAVQQAAPRATIVRSSWFNQNFSESFLLPAVLAGEVALPVNGVPEPFADAEDIADVAVAALTQEGHAGEVYELTGPRLVRFEEAVAEIARAAGRPVRFVPVTVAEMAEAMRADSEPMEVVDLVAYLFSEVLDGRNAWLGNGVQRALDREPRDFRDYAQRTAATGIWGGIR